MKSNCLNFVYQMKIVADAWCYRSFTTIVMINVAGHGKCLLTMVTNTTTRVNLSTFWNLNLLDSFSMDYT